MAPVTGLHMRTEGPSHWGAVSLPADEFRAYFNRLTGSGSHHAYPRPAMASIGGGLQALHAASCRSHLCRGEAAANDCRFGGGSWHGTAVDPFPGRVPVGGPRRRGLRSASMSGPCGRSGEPAPAQPGRYADLAALRAELAVPEGHLRRCCKEILGIGPAAYARLYLADRARRASHGERTQGIAMQS